jgi:hypothetical protein
MRREGGGEGGAEWTWEGGVILRSSVAESGDLAPLQGGDVTESMAEAVILAWHLLGFDT